MTCPNCGAELEQHTFADVCQYCGYISANNPMGELSNEIIVERDYLECYKYITRNIKYIESHPEYVSIKQTATAYEIQCAKSFHPLDLQYQIIREFELIWKAVIDKETIQLVLLTKGINSINGNIVISLDGILNLVFHNIGGNAFFDEYIIPYNDFDAICSSSTICIALNDSKYDEFLIYSHRFFNLVFDRTKYVYAIYQHLLTD